MFRDVVSWIFRILGFVSLAEAVNQREFENTLAMLYPTEKDREQMREGLLLLAKVGASYGDVERAAQFIALSAATPWRRDDEV